MPKILSDDTYNFSFSGIKSHINNLVHNERQRGNEVREYDIARSFQDCVTNHLVDKTRKALTNYNLKTLIISGGVASNTHIREALNEMCDEIGVKMFMPPKKYCTDNAAMIGAAAYILYKNNQFAPLSTNAKSNVKL